MAGELKQEPVATPVAESADSSLLDSIIAETKLKDKPRAEEMLRTFAEQVLEGEIRVDGDLEANIKACITDIDELISEQLNEIMHAEDFQRLEASWRGLHHLVDNTETGDRQKIRVLNASKKELLSDKASNFDQSSLFKKIYTSEYDTWGGAPYGLLVGDFEFGPGAQDVALLERISAIAAAAHAPFISAASPEMFELDSFTDLHVPRDLSRVFAQDDYINWRAFRKSEESRYAALVLPHYLARLPYGTGGLPVEGFSFEEGVDGTDHKKYLWGNAAYLYATRITEAFHKYGWCTSIRGEEGGGRVDGLPIHLFRTGDGERSFKCPTEIAIDDTRDKELADLGFISLVHCKGTRYAAFFSGQTCNEPIKYGDEASTESAKLSARLPYVMAVSRVAHYLKAIFRTKVGSGWSPSAMQRYLEDWIQPYISLDDDALPEAKAQRPLREAKIVVEGVPGEPGSYQARVWLRPHFQLETMKVSLRLVTRLPTAKK